MTPGKIACELAYAQGKMLDHSQWNLPRGITPSDIDVVFEDALHGRVLLVELSRNFAHWTSLSKGQQLLYSRLVCLGTGRIFAALCQHGVPMEEQIDTRNAITRFQVMYFGALLGWATSPVYEGELWPRFVDEFFRGQHFTFPDTP